MSDNTPEYIAFALMEKIAATEGRVFLPRASTGQQTVDREWVLHTYAQCLMTIKDPYMVATHLKTFTE
jgi:hypothetical protein